MDTHKIAVIYMQRPIRIMDMSMGRWFCEATGIEDKELASTMSTHTAKDQILTSGYNMIDDLTERLTGFNQAQTEKW